MTNDDGRLRNWHRRVKGAPQAPHPGRTPVYSDTTPKSSELHPTDPNPACSSNAFISSPAGNRSIDSPKYSYAVLVPVMIPAIVGKSQCKYGR